MQITEPYYLIIDLEATCSNDNSVPRDEMEIIEIGAVVLDSKSNEAKGEFQKFVRPVRHARLTEFCTKLTTITQEQIDSAATYPEVLREFAAWMLAFDGALFCSWGGYDKSQFLQDCTYHNVPYPFGPDHFNVKEAFSKHLNVRRRFGLGEALKRLGLEFEGTPHRGIDDVRNIARVVRHVCTELAKNEKPPINADKRR